MQAQDHYNDSDDISPEEGNSYARGAAQQRMDAEEQWKQFYAMGAESLKREGVNKKDDWDYTNQQSNMPN